MALIGKELASNTALYKGLCICSGCGPEEAYTEGLVYEGPSCSVMAAKTSMDFGQELPPLFFGDTSLKDFGSSFLVEISFMNLVGFRASNDAMCLILVIRELPPIKVGQEGFGPWGDYCHNYMGGRHWFCARAPDDI